ncbi:MAG: Cof-type HAD-IIB family hydrolase [Planctomycetota bacterium]|jgi:Cof subfamily protein (haloacid dehalogenase superfamily)
MRYRLLAIDLDGTLLDPVGAVSDANRRAIYRATADGVLIVLCTGRGLCETKPTANLLDHHGPMILAGGALVIDPASHRTLHRATLAPSLAKEIAENLHAQGHAVLILLDPVAENHDYLILDEPRLTDNTRWWFSQIHARIKLADRLSVTQLEHVVRVGVVGQASAMPDLERDIQETFGDRVFTQYFTAIQSPGGQDINILEIFACGVNKSQGVSWLAEAHGIAPHEIATIGDHINDIDMVRDAACGIAMANAVEEVQRVADRVTLSNGQDGVAHAIERLLAGEW